MPYANEDFAYLAGLFDGEGCFTFVKHIEKRRNNITVTYRPLVCIVMADKKIIEFVQEIFGGKILIRKHGNKNWKDYYKLSYSRAEFIEKVCFALLPFLRVKRRQAEILLEFVKMRREKKNIRWKFPYGEEENNMFTKVRGMNKRGRLKEVSHSIF